MNRGWAADFSYAYYQRLLEEVKQVFCLHIVGDAKSALSDDGGRHLVLRHDVDVDLARAVALAEVEQQCDVPSTYMVMLNSPFYDLHGSSERGMLRELVELGHEVALHFDFDDPTEKTETVRIEDMTQRVGLACDRLSDITGLPVRSVSFHWPLPQFLRGPLHVGGRVNAYARDLMDWYLSDSKGIWREGEPLIGMSRSTKPVLQLLTHPIWWGTLHASATQRLQEFSNGLGERGDRAAWHDLDDMLLRHIGLRAHQTAGDGGAQQ